MKNRLRELTTRGNKWCNSEREEKLRKYTNGWINYFRYAGSPAVAQSPPQSGVLPSSTPSINPPIHTMNEVRRSIKGLYSVMANDPAPISGQDLFHVMYGSTFKFDKKAIPGEVDALTEKIIREYGEGRNVGRKPRISMRRLPEDIWISGVQL